jgi:hypothetical protein
MPLLTIVVTALTSMLAASPPQPPAPAGHAYYPMNIGDVWVYESTARGEFRNEVVESSPVDGAMRYRVRSTDASSRTHHLSVRFEGERVFSAPESGAEQLLVDFGVALKQSFKTAQGAATVEYRAHHDTIDLPGGTYRDVREYRHLPSSGPEYSSYYARGIGLVAMVWSEPGPRVRLIEASIAGKAFKPAAKKP